MNFIAAITSVRVVSINTVIVCIGCKLSKRYIIVVLLFIRKIEREVSIIKS